MSDMRPLNVSIKKAVTVLPPRQCVYKINKPFPAALFLELSVLLIVALNVYMFLQIDFHSSVQSFFFYYYYDGKGVGTLPLSLG